MPFAAETAGSDREQRSGPVRDHLHSDNSIAGFILIPVMPRLGGPSVEPGFRET